MDFFSFALFIAIDKVTVLFSVVFPLFVSTCRLLWQMLTATVESIMKCVVVLQMARMDWQWKSLAVPIVSRIKCINAFSLVICKGNWVTWSKQLQKRTNAASEKHAIKQHVLTPTPRLSARDHTSTFEIKRHFKQTWFYFCSLKTIAQLLFSHPPQLSHIS